MSSKAILYSLISALAIAALFHLFVVGRYSYPEYRLAVGQVADFELIAPFDFPVLKSEKQLRLDRELAVAQLEEPYSVSEQMRFDAYSLLDQIFALFSDYPQPGDESLQARLKGMGGRPDPAFLALGQNPELRDRSYKNIYDLVSKIYKTPIYERTDVDSINVIQGEHLRRYSVTHFQSVEDAKKAFTTRLTELGYGSFSDWLGALLIKANLVINQSKFEELKQQRISSVPIETGEVLQNEIIIQKNSKVSEADIDKLNSFTQALKMREMDPPPLKQLWLSLGMLLYFLIVLLTANYAFPALVDPELAQDAQKLPINSIFLILAVLAVINTQILGISNILLPFAFAALAIATLAGFEVAILITILSAMIVNPFLNWEAYTPALLLLSTLTGLVLIHRFGAWHNYFRMWLFLALSTLLVNGALALYKSDPLLLILRNSGFGMISSLISVIAAAAIISFYERRWNRVTKQVLLELLDFNHPLLKKLATSAVGTYHHSLVVGNLAERAAEAIGANPLLARVGSYYHDIGKVTHQDIFTENNVNSSQIHDKLNPEESARMIRDHVKEGILLASKYRLPQDVIDIIRAHHGSSQIRFFLEIAQKQGTGYDPTDFSYPGPKPTSKEAALVMLADIVESTTKAKNLSSPHELEKIIDNTIQRLIKDGQLNDAPITIKELHKAKQSMLPVLESIYRKRLDYPDEKPDAPEPGNA